MARKLRVECPGAIYHLMNRGDRRKPIFHDDVDQRSAAAMRRAGRMEGVAPRLVFWRGAKSDGTTGTDKRKDRHPSRR